MTAAELTWRATAEANLLQARQRHSARLGGKKSRNGCANCKGRRVKCDELRPRCQRCQDSGRSCSYDSPSPPSGGQKSVTPVIGTQVSEFMQLKESERRTFDYFVSWTAPRLAGTWDKDFWCKNVLQLAQQEPFVLDSLLAISVLYEHPQYLASFNGHPGESPGPDNLGTSFEGTPIPDEHLARALKLYNRAIRRFTKQMEDGKATHAVALLSCVLFICIETIRDNVFSAMGLFAQGIEMLKRVDRAQLTADEQTMLDLVGHIFQRMALQAVLYGHPSAPQLRLTLTAGADHDFSSLSEARGALFSLTLHTHSFIQQADACRQAIIDANLEIDLRHSEQLDKHTDMYLHGLEMFGITRDPKSIFYGTPIDTETQLEEHGAFSALHSFFERLGPQSNIDASWSYRDLSVQKSRLLERLVQWHENFLSLLKRLTSKEQPSDAVSYLLMYYYAAYIWLSIRLQTTETSFDSFTTEFRKLVWHAEIYVRATALQKPIFTFEIGAVLPLLLVASKCRVPSVRRQALDLMLQSPKKESTFGAYSCAQAVCRLIAIEEEGLGLPLPDLGGRSSLRAIDDSIQPQEDKRVHSFDLLKNRKAQIYEIRVTRYRTRNGCFERVIEDFPI